MTHNDVLAYYNSAPEKEWNRTQRCRYSNIEFNIVMHFLKKYISNSATIIEFGCGPGAYAINLAKYGCKVGLVDIADNSLRLAKEKFRELNLESQVIEISCASAVDYVRTTEHKYFASLLFGPLYHIADRVERLKCLEAAKHNTSKDGYIFGIFISRYAILKDLAKNGAISSLQRLVDSGFLEHGKYDPLILADLDPSLNYMPTTHSSTLEEAIKLFNDAGFNVLESVACEGFLSFMKPYINKLDLSESDYSKLITACIETNNDDLIPGADHFLLIGQAT